MQEWEVENDDEGKPKPPDLVLQAPNKNDFNINEIIGTMELNDVNLKDNISQFMKLDKVKTDINRSKLSEVVDVDFSELQPLTFTYLLENYHKLKEQIPFYRYRTDDFWREYSVSENIPVEYRIEKFFEEFERIKAEIPKGALTPYDTIEPTLETLSPTQRDIFGWETLTYLVSATQEEIGTTNPIKVRIGSVLDEVVLPEKTRLFSKNDTARIKTLGISSSTIRREGWINNIQNTYKISSITL